MIVDLAHRDTVLDSTLRVVGDHEIEGFRRSTGWAQGPGRLLRGALLAALRSGRCSRSTTDRSRTLARRRARTCKAVLSFGDAGGELLVKVGISAVDVDGARRQPRRRDAGLGLRRACARRRATRWNEALGRIEVEGGSDDAAHDLLHRALPQPARAQPVSATSTAATAAWTARSTAPSGRRPLHRLLAVGHLPRHASAVHADRAASARASSSRPSWRSTEQGGRLPVWELAANETDMHDRLPLGLGDRRRLGQGHPRLRRASWRCEAMVHSATLDHFGLDAYRRQGFIGAERRRRVGARRRWSTPTTTGASRAWPTRWARTTTRDGVRPRAARPGDTCSIPRPASCAPRRNQRWLDALRSAPRGQQLHRGQRLAVQLLRAPRRRGPDRRRSAATTRFVDASRRAVHRRQRDHRPRRRPTSPA